MVAFGNFGRLYPLPKPKLTYEQTVNYLVDLALRKAYRKGLITHTSWREDLVSCYKHMNYLIHRQRTRNYELLRLKPYKRVSADYEAPFALPVWCRNLYDSVLDFFYNLSLFTIEKWIFWLVFLYFFYIFFMSIFYPLYSAVRKDFLHPRFFFRSPRWFVEENKLHGQTKLIFVYNFLLILFLVVFLLFYLYEAVLLIQYYDCYVYYQHLYHTVPFFEGGSSRRNGGVHTDLGWKKRLRHPQRSTPSYYILFVKDRW